MVRRLGNEFLLDRVLEFAVFLLCSPEASTNLLVFAFAFDATIAFALPHGPTKPETKEPGKCEEEGPGKGRDDEVPEGNHISV